MRITAKQLRQIIKEELSRSMREADEVELPNVSMPNMGTQAKPPASAFDDVILSNLQDYSDINIVRRGSPAAWNEEFNHPGEGNIVFEARGAIVVAHYWERNDGMRFQILKAAKSTPEVQVTLMVGGAAPNLMIDTSELTGGATEHLTKRMFKIPAMLKVKGSPGGGMFKKEPMMELMFMPTGDLGTAMSFDPLTR